jgi:hypothetical protein
MFELRITDAGLARVRDRLLAEERHSFIDRADQDRIGRGAVADARRSIEEARTPDTKKPWRPNKAGNPAYRRSAAMKRAIGYRIEGNRVLVTSTDFRSEQANSGSDAGRRVLLKSPAIVPVSVYAERVLRAAGGEWRRVRGFKITLRGKEFIVQKQEGAKRLTFLGVVKTSLMHYRRKHFGLGDSTLSAVAKVGASIAARLNA